MDKTQSHTAIGQVISKLYDKSDTSVQSSVIEEKELREVEQSSDHPIPPCIPEDYVEHQLVKNLIQTYRTAFATKGNGDPSGYGYYILKTNHGITDKNTINLVVLYRTMGEKQQLESYLECMRTLSRKHWWFRMEMDFIRLCYLGDLEECYFLYDNISTAHFYHEKLQWDPFDNSLNNLIGSPYYKIIGYEDYMTGIHREVARMLVALHNHHKGWIPFWSRKWRTKYTLTHTIQCIINDD